MPFDGSRFWCPVWHKDAGQSRTEYGAGAARLSG